ncbi:hypothetical protein FGO68_gene10516 [Halteria grandinella]|uniref:Uncharacterized protein n=1 Tax=Halteria grandinella TaxID=5974 RepID=A0A8J8NPL0_HALGN|nr:hypothetical protein FGO68_gene10516 [Halteria grandinella]
MSSSEASSKHSKTSKTEEEESASQKSEIESFGSKGTKASKKGALPLNQTIKSEPVVKGIVKSIQQMRDINRELDDIGNIGIIKKQQERPLIFKEVKEYVPKHSLDYSQSIGSHLKQSLAQAQLLMGGQSISPAKSSAMRPQTTANPYMEAIQRSMAKNLLANQETQSSPIQLKQSVQGYLQPPVQRLVMKHEGIQTENIPQQIKQENRTRSAVEVPRLNIPGTTVKPKAVEQHAYQDESPKPLQQHRKTNSQSLQKTQSRFANTESIKKIQQDQAKPLPPSKAPAMPNHLTLQDFYRHQIPLRPHQPQGYLTNGYFQQPPVPQSMKQQSIEHVSISQRASIQAQQPRTNVQSQAIQNLNLSFNTGRFGTMQRQGPIITNVNQAIDMLLM